MDKPTSKNDTSVSLKEFLEEKIAAIDKATTLAREDMNRRLNSMNEMREQINKQEGLFITKNEYDEKHENIKTEMNNKLEFLRKDIAALREFKAAIDAKASNSQMMITLAVSVIALVISSFEIMLRIFSR